MDLRVLIVAVIVLVASSGVSAQVTLREAMDTDGDNRADLMVWRPSNATWYILRANNSAIIQPFGKANEDQPAPGDFDGDGRGDISVWRDTNGTWYRLNSSNFTFVTKQWGVTGDEPVARDYNGDGRTDFAVVRRSNGVMTWYISLNGGGSYSVNFGFASDFIAPGDYDGDGNFDLAVQRNGADGFTTFYFLNSLGFYSRKFGRNDDLVVPGNYDTDNKTDIALVRPGPTPTSLLRWFILRSTDGKIFQTDWGITGTDHTVPNDYDGDGITDIAVWRNSDGKFYIRNSTTGTMTVTRWGLPNDYPVAAYDTH